MPNAQESLWQTAETVRSRCPFA